MAEIIIILLFLSVTTCIIELIPLLFVPKLNKKWFKSGLVCNLLTNPILNIILTISAAYMPNMLLFPLTIILEIAVIAFEAFIYYNITDESLKKCIIVSVICNLISFSLGLFLNNLISAYNKPSGGLKPEF